MLHFDSEHLWVFMCLIGNAGFIQPNKTAKFVTIFLIVVPSIAFRHITLFSILAINYFHKPIPI